MLELLATPVLELIILATFAALIITSLIIVSDKVGLRDKAMLYAPNEFFSKMIECNFCVAHNISAVITAGILVVDFDFWLLLLPLITATITNKLAK
jgi:hypothetical protein